MHKHFKQFLDELPDHLYLFMQENHIRSFDRLLHYTKEDLMRKRMHRKDVEYLSGALASYFYELQSDDHFMP